jgi:hypothetical protein
MTRAIPASVVLLAALAAVGAAQPAKGPRREGTRAAVPTPPPALPADVRVRSYLTQTAAWVGDPVAFVVEIETAPGMEIVAADLAAEKLAIEGLEPGDAATARSVRSDGWQTVNYTYRLTPWDPSVPARVGPLSVRIRRPVTGESGAGTPFEVIVPGATLEVRSTLPDDGSADGARDRAATTAPPAWLGSLGSIGLGLVVLGVAPVVLWLAARVSRPRLSRPKASSRALKAQLGAMFRELAIIDTSTVEGRKRAYDRLDADLRAWVAQSASVPATALTAEELRARLGDARRVPAAAICDALVECERARYGPERRLPEADRVRETIERVRAAVNL